MIDALGTPQRILLLGGTSDIGIAILRRLLPKDRTTDVILAGRDPEALAKAGATLPSDRANVRTVHFDAADPQSHGASVDEAWADGDVDVAVVAFGVLGEQTRLLDDPQAAAHLAAVNYTGAVSVGLHLARRMRTQCHGHLMAVSSLAAARARPANFIYGASKAGFDAFFDGLGYAMEQHGVTVSVIRPGFVRTRMTAGLEPPPFASRVNDVSRVAAAGIGSTGARYPSLALRLLRLGLHIAPRAVVRRLP